MDGIQGILAVAVLLGVGFILLKVREAANKAANRHIFGRKQHQQALELQQPMMIRVKAPMTKVVKSLDEHVQFTSDPLGMTGVVYKKSQVRDRVAYAFGNKLQRESFVMSVKLEEHESTTEATCTLDKRTELDGLMAGLKVATVLRQQIKSALVAAGPSAVMRSEGVSNEA
jgi:hypothetical protein